MYEEFFVPTLFQQWTIRLTAAAGIRSGQRVLDVACGTGALACSVEDRVGQTGSVVGVDVNEGMLAMAKRKAPTIEWRQARAESLPFDANSFDAVVSQFGLMFFEDRHLALQEMKRVLRRGGRLAVAVWDSLEHFEGYKELMELVERLHGDQAAATLRAPFSLGGQRRLSSLFVEAGIADARVERQEGTARFPSLRAWLFTEIKGWVLAAGVSLPDLLMREGVHPEKPRLPFTPGWDLVGVVDRLSAGISGIEPGHIVAALPINGAYAEFVCLPQRELNPVPSGLDAAEAVSLVLNYVTAYQMLYRSAKIRSGQRVLIHSVAGGVGSALVQLGRLAGLEMYGTCSSRGASAVSDMGCIPIDYQRHHCRLSSPGRKRVVPYSIQWLKRLRPALFRQDLIALFDLLKQQKIKPLISHRFPLVEARHAHELLGKGGVTGKIVLVCNGSSSESGAA